MFMLRAPSVQAIRVSRLALNVAGVMRRIATLTIVTFGVLMIAVINEARRSGPQHLSGVLVSCHTDQS